jgi:hypothetical protein
LSHRIPAFAMGVKLSSLQMASVFGSKPCMSLKIFPNMLIEPRRLKNFAFIVSPDHQIRLGVEKRKILPQPMECESRAFATDAKAWLLHSLLQFDVGLLRMTVFNTNQQLNLTPMRPSPDDEIHRVLMSWR